jgi:nickel/cobalt exporter
MMNGSRDRNEHGISCFIIVIVALVAAAVLIAGGLQEALAQAGPFGGPRSQVAPAPVGGILGWIFAKQAEFYRQFSGLIRAARADGSAAWTLLGLSFVYGVFHAAGPGHGKAVISSYLVANEETWTRGVVLSFASAVLQAAVAVALVGIAAALLNATAPAMRGAVDAIEIASYSLIVLIGLRLLFVKGRAFLKDLRYLHRPVAVGAAVTPPHLLEDDCASLKGQSTDTADGHCAGHAHHAGHDHEHHHHEHRAHPHTHHDHTHHDHAAHHSCGDDACAWGHAHGPQPDELAGLGGWHRGLAAIVAVGLRPCSGAILVLVFALAQGLFWTGVAATFVMGLGTAITVAAIATLAVAAKAWAQHFADRRSRYGTVIARGVETCAALVIIAFGTLLLTGYMVSERLVGL